MHLQIELFCEVSENTPCSVCGSFTTCLTFTVFAGTGVERQTPHCTACLQAGQSEIFRVEQAKLESGRLPPSKKDKKLAQVQERKIAEDIGGRTQPGSGNQSHAKGDVRKKGAFRIEAKWTKSSQFTITREILGKINGECSHGEKPMVQLDFLDRASSRPLESWVIIPYSDWLELTDEARKYR